MPDLSPDAEAALQRWAASDDVGISSMTIAAAICPGLVLRSHFRDLPYDAGDFGRCLRLLEKVPELRPHLHRVAEVRPEWRPIVAAWAELEDMYRAGAHGLLFRRLRDLREEASDG